MLTRFAVPTSRRSSIGSAGKVFKGSFGKWWLPKLSGIPFADIVSDEVDSTILPALLAPDDEKALSFALAYVDGRFRK